MSQGRRKRRKKREYKRLIRYRPLATVRTELLYVDPVRFQYKAAASTDGESGSLSRVTAWNFASEGVIDVWLDPADLKTYVVNGHSRLALAKRLGVDSLPCKYLPSKDWIDARRDGAISNIAQGCGTILDAARFFRDKRMSKDMMRSYGISLSSNLVKKGYVIARLCDRLFSLALAGTLSEDIAAIVGESGLSEDEQIAAYRVIDDRDLSDTGLIRELCQSIKIAARETVTELTLFGTETFESCLIFETATIQNYVRSCLSRSRRALVSAARSRDTLESAGNVIAVESSIAKSDDLATLLGTFDREKNVAGAFATAIANAAKHIKNGVPIATASQPVMQLLQGY